jgi:hypothetical protein
MAEHMATNQVPDKSLLKTYSAWADGGWGFVLTGRPSLRTSLFTYSSNLRQEMFKYQMYILVIQEMSQLPPSHKSINS